MCKALFHKGFSLLFLISIGSQSSAQSIEQLHNSKSLDFEQLVDKQLYQPALNVYDDQDVYERGLIDAIDLRKKELLSKLKVNNPEMLSDLVDYDRSLLKDYDISNVLIALIKRQSAQGISPKGMNIMQYASSMGLGEKECAELQFFHGYELFKQKRFIEAIGAFEQTIKTRSQDSNHAHYYSAMAYLLMSDFENSLVHLQKINKDRLYKDYVPYYASLGRYAKGDYEGLIKTYATTASYQNIYNKSGLAKILAFSSYNLGQYKEAIAYLNNQSPNNDENALLMLAISHNQLLQYNQTASITQKIKPENNTINERLRFESAFANAELGQIDKALYNLNDLIPSSIDVDILRWNIAVLLHRKGDYQGALSYTKPLLNSKLKNKAQDLLTVLADELGDSALLTDLASEIGQSPDNVAPIINNLYGKALISINKGNWDDASKPINSLKQIAPKSREYSQIQVLKGIKEYNDGNLLQAKILLNEYVNSNYASEINEFSIQCYYYLGYTYFKSREPKKALGYFAKSLDLCKTIQSWEGAMSYRDDLYIRLGDVHLLNNDLNNAAEAYKVIIDKKGENSDYALYQMALISELKGENYDQIILLKDLIANYPTSTLRFKAEYSCANSLFDLGKYAQAEEHYQRIVKKSDDIRMKDLSIMQIGLINVNAGDYGKAANLYNQLIANSKDVALKDRAKEALKEIYSQYDINTEAYVALAVSENSENTPDQIIWQLAKENIEYGKYKIAIDQLNKLINDYPQSNFIANARFKLADVYLKSENTPSAISAYITAIKAHPENISKADASLTLGELLFNNKAFNNEYISYSELGWFSINQEEAAKDLYRRTLLQYELGQYEKVVKSLQNFDAVKEASSQKDEIALKLLQNSLTSKDWSAITDLHKNLPDIQSPKWIYSVALAQMNQDQYDISISTITDNYDNLLKDSAWLVKSMLLLSDIYFIKGDKTSAIAALESIINSDLNIPPGIKQQVTDRLNNLNL